MALRDQETAVPELGPTIWAPFVAVSIVLVILSALVWMHPALLGEELLPRLNEAGPLVLFAGLVPLAIALIGWMRSDLRFDAANDHLVSRNVNRQRTAMILFLMSEGMLFFAFFWAFLRFAANPELAGSSNWPPLKIHPEDPWGAPAFATVILVVSGMWVVLAHSDFLAGRRRTAAVALAIAVAYGAIFLGLQVNEFLNAPFAYTDGSYASLFYIAVGTHGLHVLIGATLLFVVLIRFLAGSFVPSHHFGFEASVWYWHFVDVVWLLLFAVFYWLPSVWA
jgi:cytochrome c oxidase subunit III